MKRLDMATSISLSSKAQFTLNKTLLEHLGVKAGDMISIRRLPGQRLEITPQHDRLGKADFLNLMEDHFKADDVLSIEQINDAIADAAAKAGMQGLR